MPGTERRRGGSASEASPLLHERHADHQDSDGPPPSANRVDSISSRLTARERAFILFGVLVIGWSYGLDGLTRYTYQSYAASSFGAHSLLATVNVVRSVVAAAAHPPAAKLADVVGRFELVAVSVLFYVVGTAVESTAASIEVFIVGAVLYQIGYTCVVLLVEVVIADITSLRSRVFFSYVPAVPFVVNTWIGGTVTSTVLRRSDWRWGIGMWCLIYAASAAPLLVGLYRARRYRAVDPDRGTTATCRPSDIRRQCLDLYRQLDVVGICLAVAILGLILVPLTLVSEGQASSGWRSPGTVAPPVLGGLCIPVFVHWESRRATNPLVPSYVLQEPGVGTALAVRCLINLTWAVQGNYLYTVLVVAFDLSVTHATQVTAFFTFFGVVGGLLVGAAIFRVRRLKPFIVAGTVLFTASFALLVHFNGGTSTASRAGMLGAQVLLGVAAGLCAYPTQASVQAATNPEHVSAVTGLYLASFNVGSALGTGVAGAVWSATLPPTLASHLDFQPDPTLAHRIYHSPFEVVPSFPVGTEVRAAVVASYGHVEKLLAIAGLGLCVPMIGFALGLQDPVLSSGQSRPDAGRKSPGETAAISEEIRQEHYGA